MQIDEEKRNGVVVVAPSGRIDSVSSAELERALVSRLGDGERRLVVDLGRVEYISSAGLRVLLMTAKKLRDGDGGLVLCAMPEGVRLVFELAGFVPIFAIEGSREAAVARLSGAGP